MDWTALALVGSFVGAAGAAGSAFVAARKEKLVLRSHAQESEVGVATADYPTKFDIFLSYAQEDAAPLAGQLATALRANDLEVWTGAEGPGAAVSVVDVAGRSRYGLVILSPKLLADAEVKAELESLATGSGPTPTMLHVESGVDSSTVRTTAPELRAKFRINADELTADDLANQIAAIVTASRRM